MPIIKTKTTAFGKDVYLLGRDSYGVNYWLESPKWDCGWYWGFGYVETYTNNNSPATSRDINSHQHISGFMGKQDDGSYTHNIFDNKTWAIKTFDEKEGWELSELFEQFYFLQKAAENFGRGKCHTANANIPAWKDAAKVKEINEVIIPQVTARILEILSPK